MVWFLVCCPVMIPSWKFSSISPLDDRVKISCIDVGLHFDVSIISDTFQSLDPLSVEVIAFPTLVVICSPLLVYVQEAFDESVIFPVFELLHFMFTIVPMLTAWLLLGAVIVNDLGRVTIEFGADTSGQYSDPLLRVNAI